MPCLRSSGRSRSFQHWYWRFDKGVDFCGERGEGFVGAKAVVALLAISVLDALHEAGLADFDIFVEIGAGDGEKLDPFEEGIGGVFGFFKDAAIELHPRVVASGKKLLFLLRSSHLRRVQTVLESLQRFAGKLESGSVMWLLVMLTEDMEAID